VSQARGTRTAVLVLLAAAVVGVLFLVLRSGGAPSAGRTSPATPAPAAAEPAAPRLVPVEKGGMGPFIDSVQVEKPEVCDGEDNLVTVRAHSGDPAEDAHLIATIDGQEGWTVAVVARAPTEHSPWPKAMVMDRQRRTAEAEIPYFRIMDCKVQRRMEIVYGLRQNTSAEYDLEARIVNVHASETFVGAAYAWDFGDGATATTATPFAVHDYSRRRQTAARSFFLVKVEARSATNEVVLGRRSIRIVNTEFENLAHTGIVTLVVELNPRFPTLDAGGGVTQGVRLWHHAAEPVTITRVQARRNTTTEGATPQTQEVPVAGLLGTTTIPPAGVAFTVRLDLPRDKDVFSVDYLLEGKTAAGQPVKGTFSVMAPPVPTRATHIPVTDPGLHQRILRARQILGKELVTDEDFAELHRRGYDGFKPTAEDDRPKHAPPAYPHP
jgi:hypothetical protein